jgi:hypothetical protein
MPLPQENVRGDAWFVYDGDCPVCNIALRLKGVEPIHNLKRDG